MRVFWLFLCVNNKLLYESCHMSTALMENWGIISETRRLQVQFEGQQWDVKWLKPVGTCFHWQEDRHRGGSLKTNTDMSEEEKHAAPFTMQDTSIQSWPQAFPSACRLHLLAVFQHAGRLRWDVLGPRWRKFVRCVVDLNWFNSAPRSRNPEYAWLCLVNLIIPADLS